MKKTLFLSSISLIMIVSSLQMMAGAPSSPSFLGISISFSSRAFWDGPSQSCLPRERGWCLHIAMDSRSPVPVGTIIGELNNLSTAGLTLTFNKKTGVAPETFSAFFKNGKFRLDGEGTMGEEITRKLGLASSYTIPEGFYDYQENGDLVTIIFKK